MATKAHAAYCFESIAASLERRQPLSLSQVETLWKEYTEGSDDTEEDDDDDDTMDTDGVQEPHRPAAISRLLAPSPASTSSSSVPSTKSASSASSAPSEVSSKSSISSFFGLGRKAKIEEPPVPSRIEESPLFVTWNTVRGSKTRLRGCIGTFEDHELSEGLREYALTSAFHDIRFEKITLAELPTLECGVTLLTNFEDIQDPMDWVIGKHGLRITFRYNGRKHGSTYLPDVAKEQEWDHEETLVSLMRKAGWNGPADQWRAVKDLNVVRYQGRQIKLRYPEWKKWRAWVDEE